MIPGTSLLNNGFMGFAYLCGLGWLFLGIAIISDIFMESIEVITAVSKEIEIYDKEADHLVVKEVAVWNETVANLTLMALGSSAPEILLSVIQTVQDIYAEPPVLGASTIVGSAAFNLLVISGLSIYAVDDGEPKKVVNTGVFAITATVSLFAYIWLYLILEIISP
jgi:solute carrier family 8 (sodium/calcium exchanger)